MCAGEQGKVRRRTRGRVAQHGIPLPRHRAVAFCHPGASSASVILRSAATKDLSSREPPLRGKKILRSAQDDMFSPPVILGEYGPPPCHPEEAQPFSVSS